jgi:hypothetical protein
MQVIENFKGLGVPGLGSLNGLGFGKSVALRFSCVRQVAFSGRISSDAA